MNKAILAETRKCTTLHNQVLGSLSALGKADTPSGKIFDIILIWSIVFSVVVVMLESVSALRQEYGQVFNAVEWFFTILFTVEYLLRLLTIGHPSRDSMRWQGHKA